MRLWRCAHDEDGGWRNLEYFSGIYRPCELSHAARPARGPLADRTGPVHLATPAGRFLNPEFLSASAEAAPSMRRREGGGSAGRPGTRPRLPIAGELKLFSRKILLS